MSIQQNVSDKRTSIPGYILLGLASLIWVLSFFFELQRPVEDWVLGLVAAAGALLIIAPKKVADILSDFFTKKTAG